MSDLIRLSQAPMRRIAPYFPLSHGIPRNDDPTGYQRNYLGKKWRIRTPR